MAPRKEISADVRKLVIKYRNEKKSNRIAKLLCLSKSTVQTIFNNFRKSSSFESEPRTGRPKELDRTAVSFFRKEVDQNPKMYATKLAQDISERFKIDVYPRTVTRTLNNEGFHCRTVCARYLSIDNTIFSFFVLTIYFLCFWDIVTRRHKKKQTKKKSDEVNCYLVPRKNSHKTSL